MLKRVLFTIVVVTLVINACSSRSGSNPTPGLPNGIEGQVTEGPTCPGPIRIGATNCANRPYQATITILDADGKQITQFTTDVNGYFKVSLAPGTYILHPLPGNPLPFARDETIMVTQGEFTRVDLIYDTGMR
jgi:hypothetical protein